MELSIEEYTELADKLWSQLEEQKREEITNLKKEINRLERKNHDLEKILRNEHKIEIFDSIMQQEIEPHHIGGRCESFCMVGGFDFSEFYDINKIVFKIKLDGKESTWYFSKDSQLNSPTEHIYQMYRHGFEVAMNQLNKRY